MVSAESKQILWAILPKVTGFMSMVGSGLIVFDVLFNSKRRKKTYYRIMCGLSISDFVSSFVLVLSTWPMPKDVDGVYGNAGNHAACEAIGMIAQTFGISTPFYNLSLCCYYFMVICRAMPERKIVKHERWLHILPITFGLSTGIAGIPLTLYNPANYICWIGEDPPGCDRDPAVTCNRGSLAWLFRWLFYYGPIWIIFLIIIVTMILLYRTVSIHERASNKHRVQGQARCRRRSRKVANQAMRYVCSYCLVFTFGTITRVIQILEGTTYFPIVVLFAMLFPLQGTFNAIIYFYYKEGRWTASNVSLTTGASFRSIISKPFTRISWQLRGGPPITMDDKCDQIETTKSEVVGNSGNEHATANADLEHETIRESSKVPDDVDWPASSETESTEESRENMSSVDLSSVQFCL